MALNTKLEHDTNTMRARVITEVPTEDLAGRFPDAIWRHAVEEAGHVIAERLVALHQESIIAKIDQQAIANLVIAEAGNSIKDMLDKKLPDRVDHIVDKEIYQRGFFGGMRRIA
jgi:hypothetical protein